MTDHTHNPSSVWIFQGNSSSFPNAVFDNKDTAIEWIQANRLSGILTWYPLNVSVYNWTIDKKYFTPKNAYHKKSKFIANFSSAYQEHYHFENGENKHLNI